VFDFFHEVEDVSFFTEQCFFLGEQALIFLLGSFIYFERAHIDISDRGHHALELLYFFFEVFLALFCIDFDALILFVFCVDSCEFCVESCFFDAQGIELEFFLA